MLLIHQTTLLHDKQIITVPTRFFKALFRSIKIFIVHFVFRKMMVILSCRWYGSNSLIHVTITGHKAQFDPFWSPLTPINIAAITKHNQIIWSVKTQRIAKGSVGRCKGLCESLRLTGELPHLNASDSNCSHSKRMLRSIWPLNLFTPLGKHSSEAVRSCEGCS